MPWRCVMTRVACSRVLVLACATASLGVLFLAGCESLTGRATPYASRDQLLEGNELSLVMGRLGTKPGQVVTGAEKLRVRTYFDPLLVNLDIVKSYTIWGRRRDPKSDATVPWERLASSEPGELTPEIPLEEGLFGLRASVVYADGTEDLVPRSKDGPSVWLVVDHTPPRLTWLAPTRRTTLTNRRTVILSWDADETRFGDAPYNLEWSIDGGTVWSPVATVPASPGPQRYTWALPSAAVGDVLVRVEARDLAGYESAAVLSLLAASQGEGGATVDGATVPALGPSSTGATPPPEPEASEFESAGLEVVEDTHFEPVVPGGTGSSHEGRVERDVAEGEGFPELTLEEVPPAGTTAGGLSPDPAVPPAARASGSGSDANGGGRGTAAVSNIPPNLQHLPQATELVAEVSQAQPETSPAAGSLPDFAGQPPTVRILEFPAVCGRSGLTLRATIDEGDPAPGVDRLEVYLRARGETRWALLPGERVLLTDESLTLDLARYSGGAYDVYLRPVDRLGAALPPPGAATEPSGSFLLDLVPPRLAVEAVASDWVGGFETSFRVDAAWADAQPPLIVEGSLPTGKWEEVGRWERLPPGDLIRIAIPVGRVEYRVRFVLADAAGNPAEVVLGPRPVVSSVGLTTFQEAAQYQGLGLEQVKWRLHPMAAREQEQLRVSVWHQPKEGGRWVPLFENIPATASNYWDLPAADHELHRLRLGLFRAGKLVGEDYSEPFTLRGREVPAPTVVKVSQDSRFYYQRATSIADRYRAALAASHQGVVNTQELAELSTQALTSYRRALQEDPSHHEASYRLAQFLSQLDSQEHADEIRQLLKRTLETRPDHFWALNDLGALLIQDGDFRGAEARLLKAAGIQQGAIVFYNLGLSLFYQQRMPEARERFDQALANGGSGQLPLGEVYYYYIHSYLQEGNVEKARQMLSQRSALIPPDLIQELSASL